METDISDLAAGTGSEAWKAVATFLSSIWHLIVDAIIWLLSLISGFFSWAANPDHTSHAIIASAIFAALFTCTAMLLSRKSSKESATIDIIHTTAWDHDFITTRESFKSLRDSDEGLISCIGKKDSAEFSHVLKMLNHYELVAIGIHAGILSDKIYGKYYRTRFVCDWFAAKSFIEDLRRHLLSKNKRKTGTVIFVEFERLATKWARKYKIEAE